MVENPIGLGDVRFFATADVANTDVATYRLMGATAWARFFYRAF